MQVDAGTFITDIEESLRSQIDKLAPSGRDGWSDMDVIHIFTRAALAAMVKHSRGGLAAMQMDDQTKVDIIKALGTPTSQAKFQERGRKAAETRARNKAAKLATTGQEKTQGSGQPPSPTPITNGPEHHTRRGFGGAPVSPLATIAPTGGDGGAA